MKILNLKIKNDNNEIRSIDFCENDIFYVFGNVKKPKDKKKTSNSIGKTLALKMCDYVLGCKVDSKIAKSEIGEYTLLAEVFYKEKKYLVKRKLNSKIIFLDDKELELHDYCSYFNINRSLMSRFIQLNSKGSLLGYNRTAIQSDYVDFLTLLNLKELSDSVDYYYDLKTKIDSLEKTKNELLSLIGISEEKLSEELFINEKKVNEVSKLIEQANNSVKSLEISEDTAQLQERYEAINAELKKVQIEISKLYAESNSLKKFIEENNKTQISKKTIEMMFEKARYQVPDMVYKKIEEVEQFYKSVIEDRLNNIYSRFNEIDSTLKLDLKLKDKYVEELDSIGRKIADDGIYQSALNTINENNEIFSNLKFEQGKLNQVKTVSNDLSKLLIDISIKHKEITEIVEKNELMLTKFRDFVYEVVQKIYSRDVNAYFDIHSTKYKKGAIPITVELNISGETGEGISEVKKNIIDILLFKYTIMSDFLILDSACFNGIDPRQVSGLLNIIHNVCEENGKQAIISINKYQITADYLSNINENNSLSLSEDEKLLFKSF